MGAKIIFSRVSSADNALIMITRKVTIIIPPAQRCITPAPRLGGLNRIVHKNGDLRRWCYSNQDLLVTVTIETSDNEARR